MVTFVGAWARLRDGMTMPVLVKEMRSRMRGTRAAWLLFVASALTIGLGLIILSLSWGEMSGDAREMQATMAQVGRALFIGLTVLEGVLAVLLAPALTSGAIALEYEQQTFEFLLLTRLSSLNIVLGKLFSSLGFIAIALLCALPVASLAFLYGGVAPMQLVWSQAIIFAAVFCFGAIGVFCSSRFRKTSTATVLAFSITALWLGLLPLVRWLLDLNAIFEGNNIFFTLSLSIVLLLTLSAVPTMLIAGIIYLAHGRWLPRVALLALGGVFAIGACLLLYLPNALDDFLNTDYFLFANPVVCLYNVSNGVYGDVFSPNSETLSAIVCIGILLAVAYAAVALAVREVRRQRG